MGIRTNILLRALMPDRSIPILVEINLLGAVAGVLANAASMISKTSFVMTLLRIAEGRIRWFLWFAAISMTLVIVIFLILLLARCSPIKAGWDFTIPGSCWSANIPIYYGLFAGGICPPNLRSRIDTHANCSSPCSLSYSLFCYHGLRTIPHPVEDHLGSSDEA